METRGVPLREADENIKKARADERRCITSFVRTWHGQLFGPSDRKRDRRHLPVPVCKEALLLRRPCTLRILIGGGRTRYGNITKQGSKWLRWILIELSHHFIQSSPRMKAFYAGIACRHGKNKARVAVTREMPKIICAMLTKRKVCIKG